MGNLLVSELLINLRQVSIEFCQLYSYDTPCFVRAQGTWSDRLSYLKYKHAVSNLTIVRFVD
jgi:hypothetical protein